MMDGSHSLTRYLGRFDWILLAAILLATGFGLVVLDGSTHGVAGLEQYTERQAVWWAVAVGVMIFWLLLPYSWLRFLGWPVYVVSVLSLVLPLMIQTSFMESVAAGGAASWLRISVGGIVIRIQPSEFAKVAVTIVLAHWFALREGRVRLFPDLCVPVLLVLIPMWAIFKQPDLGGSLVFLPLLAVLIFVAGLDWRIVTGAVLIGLILAIGGFWYLMTAEEVPGLRRYQQERIQVFLEPLASPFRPAGVEEVLYGEDSTEDSSPQVARRPLPRASETADDWNIRQAEMALGSGQVFGKGWRQGTQTRLRFLPEHHTDFIFSSLGEQFGLVGCLALFFLYMVIAWRVVHIAIRTNDLFGRFIVVGLLTVFHVHLFLNLGMSVRLMPVTGVPLPLISYGGSFLVANYVYFGLILNVGMRSSRGRR